ncbi:hypothetical protein SEA_FRANKENWEENIE_363 [Streptomyces phage Frankenweenie]|nr:hypothetical protein SEA_FRANKENWEENIE_363 [Streptomyces phage Frankenweenie]
MSAVTLEKLGGDVREDSPGVGMNTGAGAVQFIGGTPTRKVDGPLILVAGMRVNLPESVKVPGPRRVRAVAVAVERDGFRDAAETVPSYRGVVITADGDEYATGPRGDMESVRLAWLRLAVESGTFQRVARMR